MHAPPGAHAASSRLLTHHAGSMSTGCRGNSICKIPLQCINTCRKFGQSVATLRKCGAGAAPCQAACVHRLHSFQALGSSHVHEDMQLARQQQRQHMQPARQQQYGTVWQLALLAVNARKPQQLATSACVWTMAVTHCEPDAPLAGDHDLIPGDALDGLACRAGDTGVSDTE